MYAHQQGSRSAAKPARLQVPASLHAAARPHRPAGGRAAAVLTLQRLAGNAAVTRLLADRQRDLAYRQRDTVRAALRASGRPLSQSVTADMEARLGADLSAVRVHTGPAADTAARAVEASAFTTGSHLVFRDGIYRPSSATGRRVLAHELVHVLQQRHGPVAGTPGPLRISHPADSYERAADTTARRALAAGPQPAARPPHQNASQAATPAGHTVQRHFTKSTHEHFGPLKFGSGTWMQAVLHPGKIKKGTTPKVRPYWWKFLKKPATKQFFKTYMVQGHLLNMKVGGTGKSMQNLTPITKACNKAHETAVEKTVKDLVLNKKKIVFYEVWADYKKHPKPADIIGSKIYSPKKYKTVALELKKTACKRMAVELFAQWAILNKAGKQISKSSGWRIKNASK
jgi:Domain of unknown function (DUF4157)